MLFISLPYNRKRLKTFWSLCSIWSRIGVW